MMFRIIIRGRNCEKYIEKCMRSLDRQTHKDWAAYIILDDPTDESFAKLSTTRGGKFLLALNNIRLGLAYNIYKFPKSYKFNNDDVLAWVDADDWLDKHALEIVNRAYQHPSIALTYGSYIKVSKGRKTKVSKP